MAPRARAGPVGTDPHGAGRAPGVLEEPDTYYYRRLMTDAVRAVEAVRSLPAVAVDSVAVQGVSQGGGWRWPSQDWFLTWWPSCRTSLSLTFVRLDVCENNPYQEITRYFVRRSAVDQVFATLSYFERSTSPSGPTRPRSSRSPSTISPVHRPRCTRLQPLRRREGDGGLPVQPKGVD